MIFQKQDSLLKFSEDVKIPLEILQKSETTTVKIIENKKGDSIGWETIKTILVHK